MNAISKRLLSWLCVIAMVLSLVPVMDLSGFAIETKAAVNYGTATLPSGVKDVMDKGNKIDDSDAGIDAHIAAGTCPMCGKSGIKWNAGTTAGNGPNTHNYYDSTITIQQPGISDAANEVICIALKSTAKVTTANVMNPKVDTINIMGTGTLTGTKSDGAVININGGTLNLYGGKIRTSATPTDYRFAVIRVSNGGGTLNMWDGAVIGPETKDTSKVALNIVAHNSNASKFVMNMYGGTIQNGVSPLANLSGNVNVNQSGEFNMYGGTVKDGTFKGVDGFGANVLVGAWTMSSGTAGTATTGTFNMYGGTVSGGTATYGGNICNNTATSKTNISGGTVSGGNGTQGGGVRAQQGTVTISGTALITGNTATGIGGNAICAGSGTLNISGGKIEKGRATDGANVYANGTLSISGTAAIENGTATNANGGGGNIAVNSTNASISGGTISGGSAPNGGSIIVNASKTLTISGGTITGGNATSQGGNIHVAGTLNISGGTVSAGTATSNGGNINIGSTGTVTISGTAQVTGGSSVNGGSIRVYNGKLNVTGGTISGGVATGKGGNIYDAGTVTISNGTIDAGNASIGGNIFNDGKVLSITGGTIKKGVATTKTENGGGNIFVTGAGSLTIDGATIEDGKAILGGNIYSNGAVTVKSGTIKNGEASLKNSGGGNIYANCTLTVSGGTISGGKATDELGYGGNIYLLSGKTATITAGTIEKGEAAYGGNVHVAGTLNLNGGSIADGTAAIKRGGNVNIGSSGAMYVNGGTVTGGTAPIGGSVYVFKGTLEVTSGSITGGNATDTTAEFDSDNVYVFTGSEATMGISSDITAGFSTTGSSNTATLSGQDVYVQLTGSSDVAITGNGSGTVYGMDAANDDYDATKCGALTVTNMTVAAEAENNGNNYRYISLPNDDGTWSFHRVDLRLTHVTLRTTHPDAPKYNGIYYKSILYADDTVGKAVASYGVAVDLASMPDENFMLDGYNYTAINGPITFGKGQAVTMNSGAINNIVKAGNSPADNASNLARKIYANPYVAINRGNSTYNMMGNQDVSYSLHDVLTAINTGWTGYTPEQQTMVQTNLAQWVNWFEEGALSVYNNIFG